MSNQEFIYAIRVMTTKKGKPRKRRAYTMRNLKGNWYIMGSSLSWLFMYGSAAMWVGLQITKKRLRRAEEALGCTCHVVKIVIREVEDDE